MRTILDKLDGVTLESFLMSDLAGPFLAWLLGLLCLVAVVWAVVEDPPSKLFPK